VRGLCDKVVAGIRCYFDMGIVVEARQNRRLVAHCHIQRVGEQDGVRLARIHAALEHNVAGQLVVGDDQSLENGRPDFAFGMRQREFYFG